MRPSAKALTICFAFIISFGYFASDVIGFAQYEQSSGEPPYGLAIQSDAQGIKLYGELFVEHYNYYPTPKTAQILRVVVRLRKGNQLNTFFADLDCTVGGGLPSSICSADGRYDATQTEMIQNAIIEAMRGDVLSAFNIDPALGITLKNIEEFGIVTNSPASPLSAMALSNIELAVK
jgi:hypothetical protein